MTYSTITPANSFESNVKTGPASSEYTRVVTYGTVEEHIAEVKKIREGLCPEDWDNDCVPGEDDRK